MNEIRTLLSHASTILLALLLPITLSAAVRDTVHINSSCDVSNAFTITIPVRIPADIDTIHYRWYCNGELINGSEDIVTPTNRKVSYTIPANSAYSGDVAFHFTYWYDDDCDEWTRSPHYVISFLPACPPIPGVISFVACSGVSDAGTVGVAACNGVSDAGVVSFVGCNGVSDAGVVGFAACDGVSNAGVVGYTACSGVSNAGVISFAPSN